MNEDNHPENKINNNERYKESKCAHGRRRRRCKDCGGPGICEHGRERSRCKDCGGSGICEHGRQRTGCKECGGSGLCEHGLVKSVCKECGGSRKRKIDQALSTDDDISIIITTEKPNFDRLNQLRNENEIRLVSNSPASRALHIG